MKVGIENGPYIREFGFEKAHEFIKSQGYDCVDYQNFVDTETPLFQEKFKDFDKIVAKERAFIESLGLEINQTHGPWRYPPKDDTEEESPKDNAEEGTLSYGGDYVADDKEWDALP